MKGTDGLLITGMHRSGTSVTARICNLLGADLGTHLMQPGLDNERGYWEHNSVVAQHEELLAALNMPWHSVDTFQPGWDDTLAARNVAVRLSALLAKEFAAASLWAVKDPRLCRLLPLWKNLLAKTGVAPAVLVSLRNPSEVTDSLVRRDGFSRGKAELLWLRHALEVERHSRGLRRSILTFDQVLADWRTAFATAADELCLSWPTDPEVVALQVRGFVDLTQRHHRASDAVPPQTPFSPLAAEVYRLLQVPGAFAHSGASKRLDAISAELETRIDDITACLLEHPQTAARAIRPLWVTARGWRADMRLAQHSIETRLSEMQSGYKQIASQRVQDSERLGAVLAATEASRLEFNEWYWATQTKLADLSRQYLSLAGDIADNASRIGDVRSDLDKTQNEVLTEVEGLSEQVSSLSITLAGLEQKITRYIDYEQERRTLSYRWSRLKSCVQELTSLVRAEQLREDLHSPLRAELHYSLDSMKYKNGTLFGFGWAFHAERKIVGIDLVIQRGRKAERLRCEYGSTRDDVAKDWPCDNAKSSGFWFTGQPILRGGGQFWLEAHFDGPAQQSVLLPLPRLKSNGSGSWDRWLARGRKAASHIRRGEFGSLFRQAAGYLLRRGRGIMNAPSASSMEALEQVLKESGRAEIPLVLVIDHDLGGGANVYRRQLQQERLSRQHATLLLTYDLPNQELKAALTVPDGRELAVAGESLPRLQGALAYNPPREIILNNFFTFPKVLDMVAWTDQVKDRFGARLILPVHDFMAACPSFTLVNDRGKFCNVPALSECSRCLPAHQGQFTNFVHCRDMETWRKAWGALLAHTDEIICFSNNSASLLLRAYPTLDPQRIAVRPHRLSQELRAPVLREGRITVGVVGTIDLTKGSRVVKDLARLIHEQKLPIDLVVVGSINEPIPDEYHVLVTGAYRRDQLPDLLEKHGINISLFPSIWPETFSYVCEELMRMRVPLVAFDLGAPAERIGSYAQGLLVKDTTAQAALQGILSLHARIYRSEAEPVKSAMRGRSVGLKQWGEHA